MLFAISFFPHSDASVAASGKGNKRLRSCIEGLAEPPMVQGHSHDARNRVNLPCEYAVYLRFFGGALPAFASGMESFRGATGMCFGWLQRYFRSGASFPYNESALV